MSLGAALDLAHSIGIGAWGVIVDASEMLDGSNPGLGDRLKSQRKRGPAYGCGCNTCCFGSPPADQAARKCSSCGTTLY